MSETLEKINRYKLFQKAADVLNSENLDGLYLQKKILLDGVDSSVLNSLFFKDKADEVRKMFQNSATLIRNMENQSINKNDHTLFHSLYNDNLSKVEQDPFISYVNRKMQSFFIYEKTNFDYCFERLIRAIASYQNKVIKRHIDLLSIDNVIHVRNTRQQIFLSYAYLDRGLSLALFYYFLTNGAFLYIDWMWRSADGNGRLLKDDLNKALCESNQFLFLRTPNSELNLQSRGPNIRQWCAWEIGNYYAQHYIGDGLNSVKKFFTNFSGGEDNDSISSNNLILSTFLPMKNIENGVIV